MDKHELRDLYIKETGNPFPDDIVRYADWLEEKFTSNNKEWVRQLRELNTPALPVTEDDCLTHLRKLWGKSAITKAVTDTVDETFYFIESKMKEE